MDVFLMINVSLFVDWDSASRVEKIASSKSDPPLGMRVSQIERAYNSLREKVISSLQTIEGNVMIKINKARIYHGWHTGTTASKDRLAWEKVRSSLRPIRQGKVLFSADIEFGDTLICNGIRMPLYDTLRRRETVGKNRKKHVEHEQKMVDTALVSDLLMYARTQSPGFRKSGPPQCRAVIIGDDDDLLPGAFMAESWGLRVYIFRVSREQNNRHINSTGITFKI